MTRPGDARAQEACGLLRAQMLPDGRWPVEGAWWSPPGTAGQPDVADWGRAGPNEFVTLSAVQILTHANGPQATG